MTTDKQYVQQSDKTLWLLRKKSTILPVYVMKVSPEDDMEKMFWFIWPAMEFRQEAYLWFQRVVGSICDFTVGKYLRCNDPSAIADLLEKAEGVTPQWYYRDKLSEDDESVRRVTDTNDVNLIGTGISDSFIDDVIDKTRICTRGTLKVILNALNQVALEWLIVKRKPVNLGFVTITALPYRVNWKAALLRFFPNSASIFSRTASEIPSLAEDVGLTSAFLARELLAVKKEMNTCEWTLEVLPGKLFNDASNQAEEQRIAQVGPTQYSDYIAYEISRSKTVILDHYRRYIKGSMRSFAQFSTVAGKDSRVIIPCTWGGQSHQARLESAHSDLALRCAVDWEKPSITSLVKCSVDEVQPMSNVRQQTAELRLAREDDE